MYIHLSLLLITATLISIAKAGECPNNEPCDRSCNSHGYDGVCATIDLNGDGHECSGWFDPNDNICGGGSDVLFTYLLEINK